MENLNCYIISQEKHSVEILSHYVNKTRRLNLVSTFTDATLAINLIDGKLIPAIAFIDLNIGDSKVLPIDIYDKLKSFSKVVFTTILLSNEIGDYIGLGEEIIHKPFGYMSFLNCIKKKFPDLEFDS